MDEVVRGRPKSCTTWFHAYATAYTILSGRRVTVALAFVKSSDGKLAVEVPEKRLRAGSVGR